MLNQKENNTEFIKLDLVPSNKIHSSNRRDNGDR